MGEPATPIPDEEEVVPDGYELSAEWLAEIQRRSDDIDRGTAKLVPWEEAREELRAILRSR